MHASLSCLPGYFLAIVTKFAMRLFIAHVLTSVLDPLTVLLAPMVCAFHCCLFHLTCSPNMHCPLPHAYICCLPCIVTFQVLIFTSNSTYICCAILLALVLCTLYPHQNASCVPWYCLWASSEQSITLCLSFHQHRPFTRDFSISP